MISSALSCFCCFLVTEKFIAWVFGAIVKSEPVFVQRYWKPRNNLLMDGDVDVYELLIERGPDTTLSRLPIYTSVWGHVCIHLESSSSTSCDGKITQNLVIKAHLTSQLTSHSEPDSSPTQKMYLLLPADR